MTITFNLLLKEYNHGQPNNKWVFLAQLPSLDSLGPIASAFANSEGGTIVIGIDFKNFHLRGCDSSEMTLTHFLSETITPKIVPSFNIIERAGKKIYLLTIPKGTHRPYTYQKRCYVMENGKYRMATIEEESHFQEEALNNPQAPPTPPLEPSAKTQEKAAFTPNDRQKKALNYLKTHAYIKNKEYRRLYDVSHKTAHLELVQLVAQDLLKSKGSGRSTCYVLVGPEKEPSKDERLLGDILEVKNLLGEVEVSAKTIDPAAYQERKTFLTTYLKHQKKITAQQFSVLLNISASEARDALQTYVQDNQIERINDEGAEYYQLTTT